MKTVINILLATLLGVTIIAVLVAQSVDRPQIEKQKPSIEIKAGEPNPCWTNYGATIYRLNGKTRAIGFRSAAGKPWLTVERHNEANDERLFDPVDTNVIVEGVVPEFKQIAEGRWEITFRQSLVKALP